MAFSVSPSVIVREVDATAVIPAIATPPAAIAGVFRWGPTNERILITSEQELASRFGKPYSNTAWQNHETFFSAADFLSYSNALFVVRVVSDSADIAESDNFEAKYPGVLGNSIKVSVASALSYQDTLAAVGDLTGSVTFNANTISISAPSSIEALQENDILRMGNDSVGYQELIVSTFTDNSTSNTTFSYTVTTKNKYTLAETSLEEISVERKWGYSNIASSAPSSANNIHLAVIDYAGEISGTPGALLEFYENLSVNPAAKLSDGSNNYYITVLENNSSFVRGKTGSIVNPAITSPLYQNLSGGADGDGEASISFGKVALGYDLFRDANEVDISAIIQGKATSTNIANYIVSNIAESRKDCVVYISPTYAAAVAPANPETKMTEIIEFRNGLQSSSYWVMDSGYKYRYDKYNDAYRWVPLNGDIAGLAARVEPYE